MKRFLFTIPDPVAKELQELVPAGKRSKFIVQYIEIPLKELKEKKRKGTKTTSKLKTQLLRDIAKARRQARRGEVYSEEEVMKQFGLL